jgi:hypothetical protein
MRPERLAVAQHGVEDAVPGHLGQQLGQGGARLGDARHAGVRLGQLLHQPAEGTLAVGRADRAEGAVQARREAFRSPLWANTQ